MITFENLSIHHKKDNQVLINQLSMTINNGDKVAIIGEEGCGKSTLLAFIADENSISDFATVIGSCHRHYRQVSYLPQELAPSLLNLSIADYLDYMIDYETFDFALFYQLAQEMGFDSKRFDDRTQQISSLSGGEKLKLQLITLLAQDPDCLLLDEPTSDLDYETINWLIQFIKNSPLTIIFISHDDYFLSETAECIIHLEQVKKRQETCTDVGHMNYQTYLDNRNKQFQNKMRLATEQQRQYERDSQKLNRTMSAVHHALNTTKDSTAGRLLAKKMKNLKSRQKRFERAKSDFNDTPSQATALDLTFTNQASLPKVKQILRYDHVQLPTKQIIDLTILGQDKLVITGKNGVGKTRLLKTIYQDLTNKGYTVSYMPQNYLEIMDETVTALDFLSQTAEIEKVRTLLAKLQLTHQEIFHPIQALSGGQKAKLFLCKMVLDAPQILLLDEPTRHFSPLSQPEVRKLFKDYPGCLIAVSHDYYFIHEVAQKIYHLTQTELKRVQ